jgi:phage terminase small subunit
MALTGKKKAFADAVLAGFSNKEAAIKAGYSAATASAAGSRLVKDPRIVVYVAMARETKEKGAADEPEMPKFGIGAVLQYSDPKAFLLAAINDPDIEPKERINAAKALLPIFHGKVAEAGKKAGQDAAAKKVASRFATAAPPKLVAAGGKKV